MSRSLPTLALATLMAGCAALATQPARADYVQPHIEHAEYGSVKIVVPVTSADPAVWSFKLRNLGNSVQAIQGHGQLQAEVVLYGPGVKMLAQPDASLKATIDQLRAAGVKFALCNNTLKGMNLDWHTLYNVQEKDIVPSGFLEVGWLANRGWAVDAMN